MERIAGNAMMTGTDVEEMVPAGTLEKPSGLEIHKGLMFVTDAATSKVHAFDKAGKAIRHLDTGLPAGSLAGLGFGGDGKLYFTDKVGGRVLRVDPR